MTGADFFIIFIVLFFLWSGSHRGIIKEFFEFFILTANILICSWIYGPISDLLVKFAHFPAMTASVLVFIVLFLVAAFVVWVISGKVEVAANIPPSNGPYRFGGAVIGFAKGILITWYLLLVLSFIPYTLNGIRLFSDSEGVQIVQSLNPIMDSILQAGGSARAYRFFHPLIKDSNFLIIKQNLLKLEKEKKKNRM
jgi:uncharacterized membrane protein required for colicin V production